MTHPLSESWAKVIRAKEHTGSFDAEVALWLQEMEAKGESATLRFEYDPNTGWLEGVIGSVPAPPPYRFGLILGDIIHNLRGALDHLAWELANLDCPNRGDDHATQFPITDSDPHFQDRRAQGMMRYMSQSHRDLIKDEQPWVTDPQYPILSPLTALADLSNSDKHQGIRPVSVTGASYYAFPKANPPYTFKNLRSHGFNVEVGAKVMDMTVVPAGPDPDVDMNPTKVPATVAIAYRTVAPQGWEKVIRGIGERVAEIVARFEPVF